MKNAIVLFILLCSFFATVSKAQQGTVEMDAVAFARDSGKVQIEIYYSVVVGALGLQQRGTGWVAQINARAEIWQDGHLIAGQDIKKEKIYTGTASSVDSAKGSLMLDGIALSATIKSKAEAVLIFRTKNAKGLDVNDTIKRAFLAPVSDKDKFFMGGIELANSLVKSENSNNLFEKVGYIISPNPSTVFRPENSKLYYYTELYVPKTTVSSGSSIEIVTRVLDGQKHEMFSNSHSQSLSSTTIPLIGSIDIDGLPTDSYILEVVAKHGGNVETLMQKDFYYDSGMKLSEDQSDASSNAVLDEGAIFAESDISRMSQLELEEKGDQAMYIGSNDQKKAWKKLKKKTDLDAPGNQSAGTDATKAAANLENDANQERQFLFSFWRGKDKELGVRTPLQSYKDYYKRVDEANRKFTYQKTPGWQMDFGRIYLTYGAPDDRNVKPVLHSVDAKPYITWEYFDKNLRLMSDSHAIFVFVDRQGGGRFTLVHSNVQGEVYEPDWYSQEAAQTH